MSRARVRFEAKARDMELKLYSQYRNSAGQRVRTALNIKGVTYESIPISLDGGTPDDYVREINPQALIPSLVIDGEIVTQSTALVEFIEETFDGPSLLPDDPIARARSRAFGQVIACEMYPVMGPNCNGIWRAFTASMRRVGRLGTSTGWRRGSPPWKRCYAVERSQPRSVTTRSRQLATFIWSRRSTTR